jgi:putative phosphoribosyl transferase
MIDGVSMPFKNRSDAGRKLAQALVNYTSEQPIVLALPRGGVPVAAEVASVLHAPIDLILVRKLGVPMQPELAMGAVVDGRGPIIVRNQDIITAAGVSEEEFDAIARRELAEIDRRRNRYLGNRGAVEITARTVIVIDDGIATGATMRAALRATRARRPNKLVLAVPVAATDTLEQLAAEVDDLVCLESYDWFRAIGLYYTDFDQVSDAQVLRILARFPAAANAWEQPAAEAGAA